MNLSSIGTKGEKGRTGCARKFGVRDLGAILALILAAPSTLADQTSSITIPPGRYLRDDALVFSGLTNVTVVATGVEIVRTSAGNALIVTNCSGVTVKGLSIDYDPLPWTQGRVVRVDEATHSAELELADGYPTKDVLTFKNQYFDRDTRELLDIPAAERFDFHGSRNLTAHWKPSDPLPPAGCLFVSNVGHPVWPVFIKRPDDYSRSLHAVVQVDSRQVRFEDVTVWASPWFAFFERDCDGTVYSRCRVERRPFADDPVRRGMARLRSANSDAFHLVRAARGPRLEKCSAHYMEDDGVNIHGFYHLIASSRGAELRVLAQGGMNVRPGDRVELRDEKGKLLPDARVVSVRRDAPDFVTDEERTCLRALDIRPCFRSHWHPEAYQIVLDRSEKLGFGSVIVSLEAAGGGFEIADCQFGHTRARGILLRARDGLVRGNEITDARLKPIQLGSEPWWLEGGTPLGTRLENNTVVPGPAAATAARPVTVFEASGVGASAPADCIPALISNGELSLSVDRTGTMEPDKSCNWFPDPSAAQIWLQGRRKSPPQADLFAFGAFAARIAVDGKACAAPDRWRQTLDAQKAVTVCANEWADGALEISSELFVPKGTNVVVIRRTFTAKRPVRVAYDETYRIPPDERMVLAETRDSDVILSGRTYGKAVTDFAIGAVASEGAFVRAKDGAKLTLDFTLAAGGVKTLDIAYAFEDNRFVRRTAPETRAAVAALARRAVRDRAAIRAAHVTDWAAYWARCEIVTPEPALNRLVDASLYLLRCNVSRWGFPVSVNRQAWSGRYFGFDEMFQAEAMAATGHFAESSVCTAWRRSRLDHALGRISHYRRPGKWGGWLFWEMDEEGDCENCPYGFWEMHIFNHATLARTMWEHYNYTGDTGYLKETAYPVMLAMARYFRNNWVYDAPSGGKYIGKCTDLERLGPARDRPFCTTCGAIDTLRLTAKAAKILGVGDEETADFSRTADELVKSLPAKDGAYTVDTEAAQASVALLAGLFPFPVDDLDPDKCRKAAEVIRANVRRYGNMYPYGQRVCPWYAGFISAAMSRLGEREQAVAVLRDAAGMVGPLGTIWEINEGTLRSHPNFATAAGNCLYAVTRLFLTEREGEVELLRGVPPSWRDYSFRLPVPGGAWISVVVRQGAIVRFDVDNPENRPLPRFKRGSKDFMK